MNIKIPETKHKISDFIVNRWSARSFADKTIDDTILETLFEAASWAPSANNEQPWIYIYAKKGEENFDKLWECLMPGNQPWAKNAAVLGITIARTTFAANGNMNISARYDCGASNMLLMLEALQHNIYGHIMGGYDTKKARELLTLPENQEPVVMFALGYLDDPDKLIEPFKTREITKRSRKPLEEIVKHI